MEWWGMVDALFCIWVGSTENLSCSWTFGFLKLRIVFFSCFAFSVFVCVFVIPGPMIGVDGRQHFSLYLRKLL